jgi:hypothetical protein
MTEDKKTAWIKSLNVRGYTEQDETLYDDFQVRLTWENGYNEGQKDVSDYRTKLSNTEADLKLAKEALELILRSLVLVKGADDLERAMVMETIRVAKETIAKIQPPQKAQSDE